MTWRSPKYRPYNFALLIIIVLAILAMIFWPSTKAGSQPAQKPAPCSNQSTIPCIAILDNSGNVIAKVNDFRFGPQGCIFYQDMVSRKILEHCGGYTMQWIGPEPAGKTGNARV